MQRLSANGGEFEFDVRGTGEPLLLIHGAVTAEAFDCLLESEALTSKHRVIVYHRRGYLGSSPFDGPYSLQQQAADAKAVINQLAGGRAHVAGHSYGGGVALQLALDAPDAVHSLVLMETLPPEPVPSFESFFGQMDPIVVTWSEGDKAGAVQAFLDLVLNVDWEPLVEPHLPAGWFERAVADIDGLFQTELPAVATWMETKPDARRIKQPVLSVLGANSGQYFEEIDALLHQLLPQTETFVVPGVTHGLQFMNPAAVAEALIAFCAKHPMRVAAPA